MVRNKIIQVVLLSFFIAICISQVNPLTAALNCEILKAKIAAVFGDGKERGGMIDAAHLNDHNHMVAQALELYYSNLLDSKKSCDTQVITFVETARLLKAKLQFFTVPSAHMERYFGQLELNPSMVDPYKRNGIFVKTLHSITKSKIFQNAIVIIENQCINNNQGILDCTDLIYDGVNQLVVDSLLRTLLDEKIISFVTQDVWYSCVYCATEYHPLHNVMAISFDKDFMHLMTRYFTLEDDYESMACDLPTFEQKADTLRQAFLTYGQKSSDTGIMPWLDFFSGKIVSLKRNFMMSILVAQALEKESDVAKIYYKHKALLRDPQFIALVAEKSLIGYVDRYENIVGRFLRNEIHQNILDFNTEHFELLLHLRTLVTKLAPSKLESLAQQYAGWVPLLPKAVFACYIETLKTMVEVLEAIDATITKKNNSFSTGLTKVMRNVINDDTVVEVLQKKLGPLVINQVIGAVTAGQQNQ